MSLTLVLFALFFGTINGWSVNHLIGTIEEACPPRNLLCPNPQYGLFDGFYWEWDYEAIKQSSMAKKYLHMEPELDRKLVEELKNEYCCRHGPCLFRCGIFPRQEIDLIRAFPTNAVDLFKLNLPELEPYRGHVKSYLNLLKIVRNPSVPAEIEEFFDTVHKNQKLIRSMLKKKPE